MSNSPSASDCRGYPSFCFPSIRCPSGNDLLVFLPLAIHLSPTLLLYDLGQSDFPSRVLDFTATSPGGTWKQSDALLLLVSAVFYLLLHSSQSLQICILYFFIRRAEYGAPPAPKFYYYSPILMQDPTPGVFMSNSKRPSNSKKYVLIYQAVIPKSAGTYISTKLIGPFLINPKSNTKRESTFFSWVIPQRWST